MIGRLHYYSTFSSLDSPIMSMDAEERPSKLRKLTHDGDNPERNAPVVQDDDPEPDGEQLQAQSAIKEVSQSRGTDPKVDDKPISKNQLKKLRRKQEWEAQRGERKAIRKEKLQQKRERKKAAKAAVIAEGLPEPEPKPREYIVRKQLPITIIIDCNFDDLMHDGERISLSSQVTRSYSDNKNARFRAHIAISSFGGHLKERFEGLLEGMYKSWRGVRFLETDFVDVSQQAKAWMSAPDGGVLEGAFSKYADDDDAANLEELKSKGEVVYLSAEAEDTLEELKPYSTYIIGGLVDKNREKGLCHRRATERGIKTARLPIGDYLNMSSRKVLTTNHVNEIMLKWLEHRDWGSAFISVIPQRKGGKLKGITVQEGVAEAGDGASGDTSTSEVEAEADVTQ